MSLLSLLPKPTLSHQFLTTTKSQFHEEKATDEFDNYFKKALTNNFDEPPRYGYRQGYVPQTQTDYGDGGAFPEIPVVQYPLGMGLKETSGEMLDRAVTPLEVGVKGEIKYDAVIKQNARKDKTIFTNPTAVEEKFENEETLKKPSQEVARTLMEETRKVLESVIEGKIQSNRPRISVEEATNIDEPTYIKFNPSNPSTEHNSGSRSRIIRMQQMPADPLEPPKFQFRKQPPRAPSPPVPILQSPPRRLNREEAAAWKIPPCISNWKNIKGFTIPLDKRLASDGRGYESFRVNSKFSALSTALYEAENVARENVRLRGEQLKKIAQQKRLQKERELEDKARNVIGLAREEKGHYEDKSNNGDKTLHGSKDGEESRYKSEGNENFDRKVGSGSLNEPSKRAFEEYSKTMASNKNSHTSDVHNENSNKDREKSKLREKVKGDKEKEIDRNSSDRQKKHQRTLPRYSKDAKKEEKEKTRKDDYYKEERNREDGKVSKHDSEVLEEEMHHKEPKLRQIETKEEAEARRAREELRRERMREQRRELRMEERRKKRGFAEREKERDITERIALGQNVGYSGEVMYDSRLFNMQSGMDYGFKEDEAYDVYDKPLFNGGNSTVYKPKNLEDGDKGVEGGSREALKKARRGNRNEEYKPVEFIEENLEGVLKKNSKTKEPSDVSDRIGKKNEPNMTVSNSKPSVAHMEQKHEERIEKNHEKNEKYYKKGNEDRKRHRRNEGHRRHSHDREKKRRERDDIRDGKK